MQVIALSCWSDADLGERRFRVLHFAAHLDSLLEDGDALGTIGEALLGTRAVGGRVGD